MDATPSRHGGTVDTHFYHQKNGWTQQKHGRIHKTLDFSRKKNAGRFHEKSKKGVKLKRSNIPTCCMLKRWFVFTPFCGCIIVFTCIFTTSTDLRWSLVMGNFCQGSFCDWCFSKVTLTFCEGHITHKGANTRIHTSIYCTKERLEWSLNQK